MKKEALACAAIAALCSATTVALADDTGWDPTLDTPIVLNDGEAFTLSSGESITFNVTLDDNPNPVVGFTFAGVVQGISGTGTWASDTRLDITAPDGSSYAVGGFGDGAAENDWDFQGSQSTDDGLYKHGIGGNDWDGDGKPDFAFDNVAKGGEWSFTFTQTFGTDISWKGVTIVLHKVPAPGALALLGIAGLLGARRRRT